MKLSQNPIAFIHTNRDLFFVTKKIDCREWLLTDGYGGYANFTLSENPISRYNSLYTYAQKPPTNRMSVLHSILVEDSEAPEEVWIGPVIVYVYKKFYKILILHKRRLWIYFYFRQPKNAVMTPLFSLRNHHHLRTKKVPISWEFDFDNLRLYDKQTHGEFFIYLDGADIVACNAHYAMDYIYSREIERGMDHNESLIKFFEIRKRALKGHSLLIGLSSDKVALPIDIMGLLEKVINQARDRLSHSLIKKKNRAIRGLVLNSYDFIVQRQDKEAATVIAGYPWFTDWGRDTMISFEGLLLLNQQYQKAREILLLFAEYMYQGLIPNHFSDETGEPFYNTIDATLWYFVAVLRYFQHTKDLGTVNKILPKMKETLDWHIRGTLFNIKMDPEDCLLSGGTQGVQLTWMDAKVGDWVVTPRHGKAIEINGLWYNALRIFNFFTNSKYDYLVDIAKQVAQSMSKFYDEHNIYDVLYDATIRPNMVIPLILPYRPFPEEIEERILSLIKKKLFTPYGLRTLDPSHPEYKPRYEGNIVARDGAYHQGTAWPFLLGFFIEAILNVKGKERARRAARRMLGPLLKHVTASGCINSVSEIFDGSSPQYPRGCFAQAWSVATILKAIYLLY